LTSVGLNFDVGQNISLTGSFDFMSSHPNFTDVKTTTVINENTTESVQSFSREMELISVTIGFRYSFRW
jgi:hypothetical protein